MLKPETLSVSWGRAAASRFAKSQEEIKADIIKALEGKLSVEFQDYSQWQRVSLGESTSTQPSTKATLKPKSKPSARSTSRPLTGASGTTTCSSLCFHPWNKKEPPIDHTYEILQSERISVLKAQIAARKNSVKVYRNLKKFLLETNYSLKDEITGVEGKSHQNVTRLLEKYEKYSGATKVLQRKHVDEVEKTKHGYRESKDSVMKEVQSLEKLTLAADEDLQIILQDLQVLRTYKDKEYPVKAMNISKLRNSVHNLSLEQKAEKTELERIIKGERSSMEGARTMKTKEIVTEAAEDAYNLFAPRALPMLAENNSVLAQEIKKNKEAILELENEIASLKQEVSRLKSMTETDFRKYVFPEAFHKTAKCSPDEDVILDIPVQQFLPI
ncbi:uncharacterized protein C20orf96-like isoform X1 [Clavelina lepadiformis]|uniref:uncharacterized protein C20orf96-like isoform X1 n=1 Tax=Clavelina lepadiformis TaxID=159417 RepID=UPI004041BF27